jgi:hypothetical protein
LGFRACSSLLAKSCSLGIDEFPLVWSMTAEECLEDKDVEASDAYGDPGIGVNCTLMIFWRFEGILCWVCSPEEDIDRRDEGLIFIEDPLSSVVSYKGCCNIRDIIPSQKNMLTLLLLAMGISLEKLSRVVLESRRPSAVFYARFNR